jgi:hypothetical protein
LVVKEFNGVQWCSTNNDNPISTGTYDFSVRNPNHDNNWEFYLGTTNLGFYNVSFTQGFALDNAERHNTTDSAFADFNGLQYLGNSGNWVAWSGTSGVTSDADYKFCKYSDTHTASKITC